MGRIFILLIHVVILKIDKSINITFQVEAIIRSILKRSVIYMNCKHFINYMITSFWKHFPFFRERIVQYIRFDKPILSIGYGSKAGNERENRFKTQWYMQIQLSRLCMRAKTSMDSKTKGEVYIGM